MNDPELSRLFDTYAKEVSQTIRSLEILSAFPDIQRLVIPHLSDLDAWKIALPMICCLAAGGSREDGARLAAAWYPMYLASEMFDEVEDQEFVPGAIAATPEVAMNFATSLVFLSFHTLTLIQRPEGAVCATRIFSSLGFDATCGQHRDLTDPIMSVEAALTNYWETIILKAGSVGRMATAGGAAAGSSDEGVIQVLGDYGTALGVMAQLLDDCRDAFYPTEASLPRWEVSLPLLLYLLATGSETIVFPGVRTTVEWSRLLLETGVLKAISMILLDWKARALESIQVIVTPEKLVLEKIPGLFLEPVISPVE